MSFDDVDLGDLDSTPERFKSLKDYAKAVVGLGWIAVIAGLGGLVFGLGQLASGRNEMVIAGAMGLMAGIGFVAMGSLISCITAIEENTRRCAKLLESVNESLSGNE